MSDRTATTVIYVVTGIWVANIVAGIAVPGYQPAESINGVFMAVVGGAFALRARGSNRGED